MNVLYKCAVLSNIGLSSHALTARTVTGEAIGCSGWENLQNEAIDNARSQCHSDVLLQSDWMKSWDASSCYGPGHTESDAQIVRALFFCEGSDIRGGNFGY